MRCGSCVARNREQRGQDEGKQRDCDVTMAHCGHLNRAPRDRWQGGGAGTGECTTATLGDKVYGLFTGNLLARIYVGSRRYATRSGIRAGDTEAAVYAAYAGQIVTLSHDYDPDGHYLEIRDGNRKVVFETDGHRVEQISTGRMPEINYVEGCA